MTASSLPLHGGDLLYATKMFGTPDEGWLDLSTGINPRPYPVENISASCWIRLPERSLENALEQAARNYYRLPSSASLVIAPGTQLLIQTLPRLFAGRVPVSIVGPTYEGHLHAWENNGHPVRVISSEQRKKDDAPILIVVNPNNPDGACFTPETLRDESRKRTLLIVDEAFADTIPENSLVPSLFANTIILRSFGKFFGLAGVRLGFALAHPLLAERISSFLGHWAVSGPALEIGARALSDEKWISETRRFLTEQRAGIDRTLCEAGLTVIGGTDLFRLIRTPHARPLYEHLARHGILVRAFTHTPDVLRFGLPASEADMQRLKKILSLFQS